MFETRAIQKRIMVGLVVLFICWPPVHAFLSLQYGFSPWKFAGWGMYATPYTPKNETLQVYVLPDQPMQDTASKRALLLKRAPLQPAFRVFDWMQGGFREILPVRTPHEVSQSVRLVKVLGSRGGVETLAESIEREYSIQSKSPKMVVLVIQPRVHPFRRITYSEVNAYLYRDREAAKLGTFQSDETSINRLLVALTRGDAIGDASQFRRGEASE